MSQTEFVAYVAIDWADQKHDWQLATSDTAPREHGQVLNKPEAVDLWVTGLLARFPEGLIAVGLEQSRGALAYQLGKYERLVLFPVHPTTTVSLRQAFYPSGSKDDPVDAALVMDLLLHHRHRLRRLDPDTVETRQLRLFVELRRRLVDERTRNSNRLTAWLKLYFPQALDWIDDIDSSLGCDFLERWPTLEQLQRAQSQTVERFFREHNSRSQARIEERVEAIRKALPAVHDTALLRAGAASTTSLIAVLKALNTSIASLDQDIAAQLSHHPELDLFAGLAGAGPVLLPRLIVAFGTQRDRFQSAAELAAYSGIAPVTKKSGKSQSVHFRLACPMFLRQTFHEFAAHSIPGSPWAKEYYQQQRGRGAGHNAAVRSLAFKWIRVLYRCWKDRTPYDEKRYLEALKRRKTSKSASAAGCKDD